MIERIVETIQDYALETGQIDAETLSHQGGGKQGGSEMSNIEKIRQEIERQLEYFKGKEDDTWDDCDNYTDEDAMWYQGHWKMCSRLLSFIDSLPEEKPSLAVEDIKKIVRIADGLLDDPKARVEFNNHNEEYYYQKVLDEYNGLHQTAEG